MLLDVNVLVALTTPDHVHHGAARRWFLARVEPFATCPLTQLGLVRVTTALGRSPGEASEVLALVLAHADHRFIAADLAVDRRVLTGLAGHRQVTDFYLAALARRHDTRLATLDQGLAAAHSDVVELIAR
ncbi:MAG: TA system VapC family ribonuclease toxin [Actinomycetota bacterium]